MKTLHNIVNLAFSRGINLDEMTTPYRLVDEMLEHYRKQVKFSGRYTNLTSVRSGTMTVENISGTGIGFRVMGFEYFKEEDLLKVSFELDNSKRSRVVANGSVEQVQGNFVGCRILQIREGEKELGFYLMP